MIHRKGEEEKVTNALSAVISIANLTSAAACCKTNKYKGTRHKNEKYVQFSHMPIRSCLQHQHMNLHIEILSSRKKTNGSSRGNRLKEVIKAYCRIQNRRCNLCIEDNCTRNLHQINVMRTVPLRSQRTEANRDRISLIKAHVLSSTARTLAVLVLQAA